MDKGDSRQNARSRAVGNGRSNASGRSATSGRRPPAKAAAPVSGKPRPTPSSRRNAGGQRQPRQSAATPPPVSIGPQWRRALERSSAPLLLRVNALPRWMPSVIMFALLLSGVFLPGRVAAIALGLVALILLWLLTLSWPALGNPARLGRMLVVGLVIFSALIRLSGLHFIARH